MSKKGEPETLTEIEITPEMIQAGVDAFWSEMTGSELGVHVDPERLVIQVFEGMYRSRIARHTDER
jgi:hypothetical protein